MDMTGYTKLFGSIIASTIWREPHTVRIVWITMLAMADKNGAVAASIPGLADLSRVTLDECKEALLALQSPDEYSRTSEHEGRRIAVIDGGWEILNHAKYRAKMGVDEKREYFRLKKQEQRQKLSNAVKDIPEKSRVSRHAEAEAQSETEAPPPNRRGAEAEPDFPAPLDTEAFRAKWAGFLAFRAKLKKPLLPESRAAQLKTLARYGETIATLAIEASIGNGWQGLFPEKIKPMQSSALPAVKKIRGAQTEWNGETGE